MADHREGVYRLNHIRLDIYDVHMTKRIAPYRVHKARNKVSNTGDGRTVAGKPVGRTSCSGDLASMTAHTRVDNISSVHRDEERVSCE